MDGGMEFAGLGDDVVGWHQQDQRVGRQRLTAQGRDRGNRGRITRERLKDDLLRRTVDLRQLAVDQVAMPLAADRHRRQEAVAAEAHGGFLDHCVGCRQRVKLLGRRRRRQWPKTRTGAARHDDRQDFKGHGIP